MSFLVFIAAIVGLKLTLAAVFFFGVPRIVGAVITVVAALVAASFSPWSLLLGVPLILASVVLVISPLRKALISSPAYNLLSNAMPPMSDTEREALEAGTSWWEKELFQGKPDWSQYEKFRLPTLSAEEQAFLDNEVEQLCALVDEWQIHVDKDLPEKAWEFIKAKGFLGLIIPKEYGGKDFSRYAQSRVMSKIASHSGTTAVSVMVPNSLGPGELIMHYGTQEEKDHWLPRLARGEEVPCFGLTGPEAGSDAGSIPDTAEVVEHNFGNGTELALKLNFSKRWITLAPIATVIGLAFKLHDPKGLLKITSSDGSVKTELGITCALIPANTKGVEIGRRHNPGAPFMNGPITGEDVIVPLSSIIGGVENAGKGWRMLMECLGVGRGISLPAMATASGEMSYRMAGAFARVRRQFRLEVGKFEGVQMANSEIAANAYMLESFRHLVTYGLNQGGTPAVMTAMAKYYATEAMRESLNHGMDVVGGRGIQLGPRNFLALAYQAIPVAITVEGANILTRSLMIFGQGAMRCHPYLFEELQTLQDPNTAQAKAKFDQIFFKHMAYTFNRLVVAWVRGLTKGAGSNVPATANAETKSYYKTLNRYSSAFALTADMALGILAGDLKRKEMLSGRLADIHSGLFIASSILYYFEQSGGKAKEVEVKLMHLSMQKTLRQIETAFEDFYANFPARLPAWGVKTLAFPFGVPRSKTPDSLRIQSASDMLSDNSFRKQLGEFVYSSNNPEEAVGRVEHAFKMLLEIEPLWSQFRSKQLKGEFAGLSLSEHFESARASGKFSDKEIDKLKAYNKARYDALLTDSFDLSLTKVDVKNPYA